MIDLDHKNQLSRCILRDAKENAPTSTEKPVAHHHWHGNILYVASMIGVRTCSASPNAQTHHIPGKASTGSWIMKIGVKITSSSYFNFSAISVQSVRQDLHQASREHLLESMYTDAKVDSMIS